MRRPRGSRVAALTILLLGLGACGGGGGGGTPPGGGFPGSEIPTGGVEGTLRLEGYSRGVVVEAEPNDAFGQGQPLGVFHAGQRITLVGSLTADGGEDPFDGYRLRLGSRLKVTANLTVSAAQNLGVVLGVYDPTGLQFAETFTVDDLSEVFSFHGKGSLDLVLTAAQGSLDYTLVLDVQAPALFLREREPNDGPGEAQYFGEVLPGDELEVHGDADVVTDSVEAVLVSCPAAVRVECELTGTVGSRYAVRVLDASADIQAPTPIELIELPDTNIQTGVVDVPLGTLLHVQAEANVKGGQWTLKLRGLDPAGLSSLSLVRGAARLAPLAAERQRLGAAAGREPYGRPREQFVPGEVLVRVRDEADAAAGLAVRACHVRASGPSGVRRATFAIPDGLDEEDRARLTLSRIRGLCGCDGIEYAEPNHVRRAFQQPDDTYYNWQWHYDMIGLPQAWDISTGSLAVRVAVLDTGQFPHPDLPYIHLDGYDFISNAFYAMDGDGLDNDPTDPGDLAYGNGSSFHGTHVAGTIAARSNNGTGVAGICWDATLMTLRVLGRGGAGTDFDIANAIRYAAGLSNSSGLVPSQRADVINMSLGGPGYNQTLADACAAARAAGVLVIASAGNSGDGSTSYPAAYSGVVSVASVGSNWQRAPYSTYGPTVDIAAPGGNSAFDLDANGYGDGVLSTWAYDFEGPATPVYTFMEGTSMAAPHVAGVAALMLSVDPALTVDDLENALFQSAQDLGSPGRDDLYGHGLVDAYQALLAVGGSVTGPPELSVFPPLLNFGTSLTTQDVALANLGDQFLTISGLTVTTRSGGAWLTAFLDGPGDATRNADRVVVTVNRSGLLPGTYRGSIEIASDGGTQEVGVIMTVPSPTPLPQPDIDIHVLAVRLDTDTAVQSVVVNPRVTLDYAFASLPVGEYVFVAGTDLDDDGEIGDEGEYIGMYPVLGAPVVVEVFSNLTWTHVDFSVSRASGVGLEAVGPSTPVYRLP